MGEKTEKTWIYTKITEKDPLVESAPKKELYLVRDSTILTAASFILNSSEQYGHFGMIILLNYAYLLLRGRVYAEVIIDIDDVIFILSSDTSKVKNQVAPL